MKSTDLAKEFASRSESMQDEANQIYKYLRRSKEASMLEKHAERLSGAVGYLEKRTKREYGSGHDMSHHGEGKPYPGK